MAIRNEMRILSPTAILGYGFPADSLCRGMDQKPDAIAVDAGSTDAGPHFLGIQLGGGEPAKIAGFLGTIEADLRPLLKAAVFVGIPLIVGSAGGAGGNLHLAALSALVKQIAQQERLKFRFATIKAEIDSNLVKEKLRQGKVTPLGPVPAITEEDIDRSVRIVAQMGVEPFMRALEQGAQVVVAGRASDPAMFAALPLLNGYDKGLALHMGKVLECGAIAAHPGSGSDVLLGTIRHDHFLVEPMNPERICTTRSVAAHSLYEASDPWFLHEPGGVVTLKGVSFTQETERCVRVAGSRFKSDAIYRIKLEGAERVGFRTICIAGVRDPAVIQHLNEILDAAQKATAQQFKDLPLGRWNLNFRIYGKNGVMGPLEPESSSAHEVGLVIEVIASTQEQANSICLFSHAYILHHGFPGRRSTAGNLAFPFSPQDIPMGPVHRFNLYHLMEIEDPLAPFPIEIEEVE